jgi:hypothetical protein
MYSASSVAVDKGLGFDLSAIGDLVKSALPVGLNIFQNQMQLKQVKAMQKPGYIQQPDIYNRVYGNLPLSQYLQPRPTFGEEYDIQSSGMSGTTMALIGAATLVVGLIAFKALK